MILLIAIVQSEDVTRLSQRLLEQEFRLTQINATGAFLAAGRAVLLLGVEDERVPDVFAAIEATCQTRVHYVNATPWQGGVGLPPMTTIAPMEVLVGGAVVFGLPVRHYMRLTDAPIPVAKIATQEGISSMSPATEPATSTNAAAPVDNTASQLVVAIVHNDDASAVSDALLSAGHRLTRLNTAGGFLRRGNATLLIGVDPQHLDQVLALIQSNCKVRTERSASSAGAPTAGATVFVLDASHFMRF